MTREIHLSRGNSPYVGHLSKGCKLCMRGEKLVLFVTGECSKDCYYCPISEERYNQKVIFANEVEVTAIEDIIAEAQLSRAMGMGITGGEPLQELGRTLEFIRAVKSRGGESFHIHLYTGLEPVPFDVVEQLLDAGLDEVRLHRFKIGEDYRKLRRLTKGRAKLGLEIPVIPGMRDSLKELFRQLDEIGIDFINLNEMEFTSGNAQQLRKRGFKLESGTIAAVQDSEAEAIELLEWAAKETSLSIHYCPLGLKDGAQLRNRFKRRARSIAKPFERISKEGLLVKGVITPSEELGLTAIKELLEKEFQVERKHIWVNEVKGRIETAASITRCLAKRLKAKGLSVGIVEEYPIDTRFQVSYFPL
ncbi:MAG: radical SAM protein [Promethearchaeota archaeon]